MAIKFGFDAKMYINASGLSGGSWSELSNIRDLTLSVEKDEDDVTTRANNGWKALAQTLKDGSIEFEMVWDNEDANFVIIKNAFFNNTAIGVRALDGEGGEGLQAEMEVKSFNRQEQLASALKVNVTLKPAYSPTSPPQWVQNPS